MGEGSFALVDGGGRVSPEGRRKARRAKGKNRLVRKPGSERAGKQGPELLLCVREIVILVLGEI